MNYRRSLFKLEKWSPRLAQRIWGLAPELATPVTLLLGFKINKLDDFVVEIEVPNTKNQRESSSFGAAAEFATRALWTRHILPEMDTMELAEMHLHITKSVRGKARGRAHLDESEREKCIRDLRQGKSVSHEISVVFVDDRGQQLAQVVCVWRFKSRILTLK